MNICIFKVDYNMRKLLFLLDLRKLGFVIGNYDVIF